eukprot:1189257-Prorocentrum_minimum.AAC.7
MHVAHVVAVEEVLGLAVVGHAEVGGHALDRFHEVHSHRTVGGPEVVGQVPTVKQKVVGVSLDVLLHVREGASVGVAHIAVGQDANLVGLDLVRRALGGEGEHVRPARLGVSYVVLVPLPSFQALEYHPMQRLRCLLWPSIGEVPADALSGKRESGRAGGVVQ